jgi:hypothetical protein
LIDELDSLFFSDSPKLVGKKFLSVILLLNKYKIIGMSATFRGAEGTKWILRFLRGSVVQTTGNVVSER